MSKLKSVPRQRSLAPQRQPPGDLSLNLFLESRMQCGAKVLNAVVDIARAELTLIHWVRGDSSPSGGSLIENDTDKPQVLRKCIRYRRP